MSQSFPTSHFLAAENTRQKKFMAWCFAHTN